MKAGLTEIGSASLFHEYLQTLGIRKPPLTSIERSWEYKRGGKAAGCYPDRKVGAGPLLSRCQADIDELKNANTKKPPDWEALIFTGADTQSRTGDLILTKDALYQLSHISTLTGKEHTVCVI